MAHCHNDCHIYKPLKTESTLPNSYLVNLGLLRGLNVFKLNNGYVPSMSMDKVINIRDKVINITS